MLAIEEQFGRDTVSNVAAITEIGEYLRAGGGKRIRPALLLLSAKLLGYQGDGAVKLASVVEIIHTATLVHDDIIDEAQIRRGRPAANTQWGNSMCVLAGDWLYMQAFKIAVQERNFRIVDVLIELTQHDGRRRAAADGKTRQADLAAGASRSDLSQDGLPVFGVHARRRQFWAAPPAQQEEHLGQYGRDLGLAFQIVDDVLDLTASESVLGKPVASDLREGKATMSVIHALERCTAAERRQIETILRDRAFNGVTHADILAILNRYGSLEYASKEAARYAESARNAICIFPDSEIKRALLWAPEFVVAREK